MSFYLIENNNQLENFHLEGYRDVFVNVVPFSYKEHPTQNDVSLVYVRPWNSLKGYVIIVSHADAFSCDISRVFSKLDSIENLYVVDKKDFLHYFIIHKAKDLTLTPHLPNVDYTNAHLHLYHRFPNKRDINRIVPISKHYEYCENLFQSVKDNKNIPLNEFYNYTASTVFNIIERNGIKVNKELFEETFHPINLDYAFTHYNFKTTTTRPSNAFNGVNYASLNKKTNDRECFIPDNDKLIEIDISAFHPSILLKHIEYEFPTPDIHAELASLYGVDYKKGKEITFKQIYGGIFKEYKDLEFFKQVQTFTDKLWMLYQNEGYLECPISGHKFYKDKLTNMSPQKLLNYYLQTLETAYHVSIVWEVLNLLRHHNTKIILYSYDAILLDFDNTETELLNEIKQIYNKNGFKITQKEGLNYKKIK